MFFIKSERILDGCVWASPVDLFLFYPFDNQIAPGMGVNFFYKLKEFGMIFLGMA